MRIVPVIDIRNGAVVRAVAGRRADYRPLRTALAKEVSPLAVAQGLMAFYPFETLYIADLDAIEGRGDNRAVVRAIGRAFPALELWIDPGIRNVVEASRWLDQTHLRLVLGSESLSSIEALIALNGRDDCVLSLDFQDARFLGDPEILKSPALWPSRLVVMTLSRVGGEAGPDLALLEEIVACAGEREVFGAGGVRHAGDVAAVAKTGAKGVLVSSALHNGGLRAIDLTNLKTPTANEKGEPARLPLKSEG